MTGDQLDLTEHRGQASMFPKTATDERAEETDTAERCDDPTPRGVIRAALEAAIEVSPFTGWPRLLGEPIWTDDENGDMAPLRVLDVCAGYGAWASEMRLLAHRQGWPVHITGVEILEARRKHMRKWCDVSITGHWSNELAYMEDAVDAQGFDLAIGNPPFDELTGPKGAKRPPEECMPAVLLRHAPAVLLLHTQQAFLKSAAGRACWRAYPPAASWLVPGGVSFRGPGEGADSRCYQVTLWLRGHAGPCSVYMLDDLPPSARSWTVPPGTEEPSMCGACDGDGYTTRWSRDANEVIAAEDCPTCGGSGLDPNGDLPSAPGYSS